MALDSLETLYPHEKQYTCFIPECIDYGKVEERHVHRFKTISVGQKVEGSEGKNSYRVPIEYRFDLIPPFVLRELAAVYEEGANKYGDAKYIEKPLPFSVIINHMENHINLWLSGDRSERHMAKVMWGAASLMVLEELANQGFIESMCDVSMFGAKMQEALQKRKDNAQE